jgi:hypothetical protein
MAKLQKLIQTKAAKLERLNMLVKNRYEGNTKPEPKVNYKDGRYPNKKDGLGHYKGGKVNDRKVVKRKECVMFTKGSNLEDFMNIAPFPLKPRRKMKLPSRLRSLSMSRHQVTPRIIR